MRNFLLIAVLLSVPFAAFAVDPEDVASEAPERVDPENRVVEDDAPRQMKKDEPRPKPTRWPPKLQKMYRHSHPHPAVVGVMRPYKPIVRGKQVYVNSPGSVIHEEEGPLVHSHAVPISEEEAHDQGYRDAGTKIPRRDSEVEPNSKPDPDPVEYEASDNLDENE